jgi:hypothetical protein
MRKTVPRCLMLLTPLILTVAGCGETPDERLADLTRQSLEQQARQNDRLMDQSQRLTEAAKDLVAADAQARQEFVALNRDLQAERASIDRQREDMERERRELAAQRHRDPIIAQAIDTAGVLIACLLPLLVCLALLYVASKRGGDADAMNELLVRELAADRPGLLPAPAARCLADESGSPSPAGPDKKTT